MKVISLQSGSNGNCIYVETDGVKLLFDAGISANEVEERLAIHGRDAESVDAVLISHDHIDHCRSMGILNRTFGLLVCATAKTYEAAKRFALGEINDLRYFVAGKTVQIGKVTVEMIPTPHDGVDGVVFVVDDGKHRLGILTDLGHVFDGLAEVIASWTPCCWKATTIPKCSPTAHAHNGSRNGLQGQPVTSRISRPPRF